MVKKGSMKMELQDLSVDIAEMCSRKSIDLQVQWVPRSENSEADLLSREIDVDDCGVSQAFFSFINARWGLYTVDRFADENNAKLAIFNSKFWCPGTAHVDAFSTSWSHENNWLVPPIVLLCQTIKHVRVSRAYATLVIPEWQSAPFWPMLFARSSVFARMVVEVMRFSDPDYIFVQGKNRDSIFGTEQFRSAVLCVKLDGSFV